MVWSPADRLPKSLAQLALHVNSEHAVAKRNLRGSDNGRKSRQAPSRWGLTVNERMALTNALSPFLAGYALETSAPLEG